MCNVSFKWGGFDLRQEVVTSSMGFKRIQLLGQVLSFWPKPDKGQLSLIKPDPGRKSFGWKEKDGRSEDISKHVQRPAS